MSSVHWFTDSNGTLESMHDRPFVAILPKRMKIGDEIVLKGKIKSKAKIFSVNLTLDCGLNIAYHFETNFIDDTVIQDYKINGRWNGEKISENIWIDGPGQKFVLTFYFDDEEILIYTGDEHRNYLYRFAYQFDVGDIKTLQVWDDVDYINEIVFRLKQK